MIKNTSHNENCTLSSKALEIILNNMLCSTQAHDRTEFINIWPGLSQETQLAVISTLVIGGHVPPLLRDDSEELWKAMLTSSNAYVRYIAAERALFMCKQSSAIKNIILSDENPLVRSCLIEELGCEYINDISEHKKTFRLNRIVRQKKFSRMSYDMNASVIETAANMVLGNELSQSKFIDICDDMEWHKNADHYCKENGVLAGNERLWGVVSSLLGQNINDMAYNEAAIFLSRKIPYYPEHELTVGRHKDTIVFLAKQGAIKHPIINTFESMDHRSRVEYFCDYIIKLDDQEFEEIENVLFFSEKLDPFMAEAMHDRRIDGARFVYGIWDKPGIKRINELLSEGKLAQYHLETYKIYLLARNLTNLILDQCHSGCKVKYGDNCANCYFQSLDSVPYIIRRSLVKGHPIANWITITRMITMPNLLQYLLLIPFMRKFSKLVRIQEIPLLDELELLKKIGFRESIPWIQNRLWHNHSCHSYDNKDGIRENQRIELTTKPIMDTHFGESAVLVDFVRIGLMINKKRNAKYIYTLVIFVILAFYLFFLRDR